MKPQNRINNPRLIEPTYIDAELKSGNEVIVQFSERSYNDKKLEELNELCGRYGKDFEIRFYGHYSSCFDFKTLLKIPNVKSLYVDCLMKADNIESLCQLENLQKLSLGVFELKETEILNSENLRKLEELIITETKTRAFNLHYLKHYKNLKFLIVADHTKNIESIGEVNTLEFLSLNSLKKTSVPFINNLKKLKTLRFILGGRENINEIEANEIENLEIIRVRGFKDIGNISRFEKLKTLLVEDNIQLPGIHFDKELPYLEDVKIINCKSLVSLTGLENLPALHHLRIARTALDFEKLILQKLPPELKIFAFYTFKQKIDKIIQSTLEQKGYKEW